MFTNKLLVLSSILFLLSGCKLVDLQTKSLQEEGLNASDIERGKALLASAREAQGLDNMANFSTYSVIAEDHWKGMLGKMGKVWPSSRVDLELKYAVNTFDSQVTFLSGKAEGLTAGLQSWKYYEQALNGKIEFKEKADKRIRFGLSAFHYFFELGDRLAKAPIITALEPIEKDGTTYDRVFATWHHADAHMDHDQYIVWISRDTGLIEYANYTVRDTYLKVPGWKAFYGSIRYSDFREINGVKIPFIQHIFLNDIKKDKRYLHRLTISEFAFDSFDIATLYPNGSIPMLGDAKVD